MARQDDSTATQQDQPPKEYKPETQAGPGILAFDQILGLTDVEFLGVPQRRLQRPFRAIR